MKQTLQLRLGQQLTMTPQLQQAIRLLQLSTLDLQQEIQEALDTNIMLETGDEDGAQDGESSPEARELDMAEAAPPAREESAYQELPGSDSTPEEIPGELPVDVSWDDVYGSPLGTASGSADEEENAASFQRGQVTSLRDHLAWQMELTPFTERDYSIAAAIIDAVNDDGYLGLPPEEIHEGLQRQIGADLELDEVYAVLHRVQNFEPPGVAALDLGDCLRIQLAQLPGDTPWKSEAIALVSQHLDCLAKNDLNRLKRLLQLDDEALGAVIRLIRSLKPHPGRGFAQDESQYVVPDVFVQKRNGRWTVSLNPDIAPRLRVNAYYSSLVRRADDSPANQTLRNHLQEARWFIKSLQSRNETLLKVAQAIVERQRNFLEHGEIAMKPLVLRDIAEAVEMHESTISRVTTQKYMHAPNGIYEFKYFFSSHVSTDSGGECSAVAIKAQIRELIDQEDAGKPLSDLKIAEILIKRGINVARRTVAKYREAMNIASSSERKRSF
jgi:RNA polymerase sigma-54 factor